ncbi:MAG TPA: YoaK family protein [Sphingobacteriaceae bacterium]
MFRHTGKRRTWIHNLKLAALLSFVAGIVNVTGFFAVQKLTTNVTGHFAFFADEVVRNNFAGAMIFITYILAFFAGAFVSNTMAEIVSRKRGAQRFTHAVPVTAEILVLVSVSLLSPETIQHYPNLVACALLFAMGLQNALVTYISNSVVRTTHLTGMFTDLGIELSQLIFFRKREQRSRLVTSVNLRLAIICFFFLGCLTGGYLYFFAGTRALLLAVAILIGGSLYDTLKFRVVSLARRHRH